MHLLMIFFFFLKFKILYLLFFENNLYFFSIKEKNIILYYSYDIFKIQKLIYPKNQKKSKLFLFYCAEKAVLELE